MKHTLARFENNNVHLSYKPVRFTKYEPKERVY